MATAAVRNRQALILARMMLTITRVAFVSYPNGSNLGAVFSQMLVAWAIRAQHARHKSPVSISRIAKITSLPRPTVRRCVGRLLKLGTITKRSTGYIDSPNWIGSKIDPRAVARITHTILSAGNALRKLT